MVSRRDRNESIQYLPSVIARSDSDAGIRFGFGKISHRPTWHWIRKITNYIHVLPLWGRTSCVCLLLQVMLRFARNFMCYVIR